MGGIEIPGQSVPSLPPREEERGNQSESGGRGSTAALGSPEELLMQNGNLAVSGRWQSPAPPPRVMLITLCYLYLWARWGACSAGLIRRTVHRLCRTRCSFTFCTSSAASGCSSSSSLGCPRLTLHHQPPHLPLCKQEPLRLSEEIIYLRVGDKIFFTGETQSLDDLNKWTLLGVSPFSYLEQVFEAEHITFVTEGIFIQASSSQAITCSAKKIVKWSDFCSPLAFKTGKPYILFAEASIDNFSSLGIAFMEDRLQMDNGMVPQKIIS